MISTRKAAKKPGRASIAACSAVTSPNGTTLNPGTGAPKPRWKNCVSVADMPASVRPWKALRAARIPVRPVRQRASLIAASIDSAPLFVKTTCARPGGATASNRCASSPCAAEIDAIVRFGSASRRTLSSACHIAAGSWPNGTAPNWAMKSA